MVRQTLPSIPLFCGGLVSKEAGFAHQLVSKQILRALPSE